MLLNSHGGSTDVLDILACGCSAVCLPLRCRRNGGMPSIRSRNFITLVRDMTAFKLNRLYVADTDALR
jgi:hypothetical protein